MVVVQKDSYIEREAMTPCVPAGITLSPSHAIRLNYVDDENDDSRFAVGEYQCETTNALKPNVPTGVQLF